MLDPLASAGIIQTVRDTGGTGRLAAPANNLQTQSAPSTRLARPDDAAFLTVEPDGRDDVGFLDRLRHALQTVFTAVQQPDEADAAVARAIQAADKQLNDAAASGESYFVQIRIVGVEVAYAEGSAEDAAPYASYRRLGVQIGVARAGVVRAEDVAVVGLDGRAVSLNPEQRRAGLSSGTYRQVERGPSPALSGAAGERLQAARASLARVKAMQDALGAYRSGDFAPLKRLLVDGEGSSGGSYGAVFPGIGALALN